MAKKNSVINIDWYLLMPLIFLLTIVPLIVYLKVVPLAGPYFDFWTGQKENLDFFSYYKMVWILISSALAVGVLALVVIFYGFQSIRVSCYYYIPIAVYTFFVILSTEFSEYMDISLTGFTDRYEGMYVLLAYVAVLFVTINLVNKEFHIKVLLGTLFTGASIIGLIGLFQFIGYDIFNLAFGKNLILPAAYKQMADTLQFTFPKYSVYSTLYNINYVGSYMAMLFPLTFTLFVLTKRSWLKLLFAGLNVLMAVNLFGSNSRAGILGGVLALVILIIMLNKCIIRNWKYFLGGLIIVGILVFSINYITKGYLESKIVSLIPEISDITGTGKDDSNEKPFLQGLDIKGNQVDLVTSTGTIKFEVNGNQITFKDKDGRPINMKLEQSTGKVDLQDDQYKDYTIILGKFNNTNALQLEKGRLKLLFSLDNNKVTLLNNKGQPVNLQAVEKWGFEGKELLGSSRGYIWSRSIPLLKNTIFIGYGPDTFAIYFPQDDIIGKFYAFFGDMWQVVDKPHNYYLQVALNTGIVSLLALLSLFIAYFVRSCMLYFRNDYSDFVSKAGVAIFVSVCGYLGAAFFNDSIVSVAPVFWVLLGLGISTNYILEQKNLHLQLATTEEPPKAKHA